MRFGTSEPWLICLQWICPAKFFICSFEVFIIVGEVGVLQNRCFSIFSGKHLCQSLFLTNIVPGPQLQPILILKRCSDTGVFLTVIQNFSNIFFSTLKKALLQYKKRGSDIYRKSNYAAFCLKLRQDFCYKSVIKAVTCGLYKILSFGKITKSSK